MQSLCQYSLHILWRCLGGHCDQHYVINVCLQAMNMCMFSTSLNMQWEINARRYYVGLRQVTHGVLTLSLFIRALGMSKIVSPTVFAALSMHGLATCYVLGRP